MPTPQKKERRGAKASISIPALIPAKTHKDTQLHTEQTIIWPHGLASPIHCLLLWWFRPSLVSYPGLLTPAFVACSTNAEEGQVKLIMCNDVAGRVEEWRSGTFPEKPQVSTLLIANMDHRMIERSTSDSLGDVSWVQNATLQLYRRNVPLLHTSTQHPGMSLHVISFTRPSPVLVLQATNTGVRRPGYEASFDPHLLTSSAILQAISECKRQFQHSIRPSLLHMVA